MTAFGEMLANDMAAVTSEQESAVAAVYHSQDLDLPQRVTVMLFYEERNFKQTRAGGRQAQTMAVATLMNPPGFVPQLHDRVDVDGQSFAVMTPPLQEFGVWTLELGQAVQDSFGDQEVWDDV